MESEGDPHPAASEASVDGASQMGLQAMGTSLSVRGPHAFSPDPSALGRFQRTAAPEGRAAS